MELGLKPDLWIAEQMMERITLGGQLHLKAAMDFSHVLVYQI